MKLKSAICPLLFLFSVGCVAADYFAVSISGKSDGGIYRCSGSKKFHTPLPRCNYLIPMPGKNFFCATQNGVRKENHGFGNLVILREVPDRPLQITQSISTKGVTPCHVAVSPDGKFIYTANYSSGSISEFPFDGQRAGAPRVIRHHGASTSGNRRQQSPHPHFVGFHPRTRELFVCDLGTDEVLIYRCTGKGIQLPAKTKLSLPPGSGPRHLAFSPCGKYIFVANELNSTVTSFACTDGVWQRKETISTRRKNAAAAKNFPGAIKITGNGAFFMVTNRGDDDIAAFMVADDGSFIHFGNAAVQGKYPSDILIDDTAKLLRVINLKSNSLTTFTLQYDDTSLKMRLHNTIPIPRGIGLCR